MMTISGWARRAGVALAAIAWLAACGADDKKAAAATDTAAADNGASGDSAAAAETAGGTDTKAGADAVADTGTAGQDAAADTAAGTDAMAGDTGAGDMAAADTGMTDAAADAMMTDAVATDITAADTASAAPTCEAYCKAVVANCSGANAQYKDEADCNTYCKTQGKLPAGTADDKSGDTVGCRTYHATAAKADPATHCPHAGKTGGNVCGSWCDNYCQLVDTSCLATKQDMDTDKAGCMAKCGALKMSGKPNDAAGDTVQCRIYHLGVAGTDEANAKIHCPHGKIAPAAGTPCTDAAAAPSCEAYCKAVTANCKDANAQYKDEADCNNYCKVQGKIPAGMGDDKAGDTIGCRTYHAGAAATDPATHCMHAGKSGGNVCGSWADNYCQLAQSNCTGDNKIYADAAACMTAAAGAKSDGKANDAAGDNLQCRIYHLGVAGTDDANAKIHCPHGKIPAAAGTPCGPAVAAPKTVDVITKNFQFSPQDTMISVGDSVKFTLESMHNVVEVSKDDYTAGVVKALSGGPIGKLDFGATKTITFPKAGTYYFFCEPHAPGMKGTITVM